MAADRYNVEALLRPPVEFVSGAVALMLSFIAKRAPSYLMMTPNVAQFVVVVLLLLAMFRIKQGWEIWSYHRALVRLPRYAIRSNDIPISDKELFLGKGFWWGQRHTQRLLDLKKPENEHYLKPGMFYRAARKLERACERGTPVMSKRTPVRSAVARALACDSKWNPVRPLPPVGGHPELHGVGMFEGEDDITQYLGERVGHTGVIGTTRVGKTRTAEILITQDIHRGDIVVVIDPKGDPDLMRRTYLESKKAGRPCYVFHLGFPEFSARYNSIGSFSRITEVATRVTDPLPSQGNAAAFKEFGWRFVNIIAGALVAVGRRPVYQEIRRYINDIEPLLHEYAPLALKRAGIDGWESGVNDVRGNINERMLPNWAKGRNLATVALVMWLRENPIQDPVLEGLRSAVEYDKTYFDKIVSSVGPLMEKLTTGKVSELISPDYLDVNDSRPIFDWMQVFRKNAVVYIGLDALSDSVVSSAVGASMFADMCSTAGEIYKRGRFDGLADLSGLDKAKPEKLRKISIHADEFNELIGDQMIPILNKAGGADYQLTLYTQTLSDIMARLGDRAKTGQVLGNINTLIMMRVKEIETAKYLTDQLPEYKVSDMMAVSGVTDTAKLGDGVDFVSRNEDRISTKEAPALMPNDIMTLPKGQAFVLLDGGKLAKIRSPLPIGDDESEFPSEINAMAAKMRQIYAAGGDSWADDDLSWATAA